MYEGWDNVPEAVKAGRSRGESAGARAARVRGLLSERGYSSDYLNLKHAASRLGLYRKGDTKQELERKLMDFIE